MKFEIFTGEAPYRTTDQIREVDRAMIEDFKIDLIQMMENAGRNPADLARRRFFDGDPQGRKVTVLAGPAIKATATMTLALPKEGLRGPVVSTQIGELYLADMGVPSSLSAGANLGLKVDNIFARNDITWLH